MTVDNPQTHWDEETSNRYIDYGRFFVPQREHQMRNMVDLLKGCHLPAWCLSCAVGRVYWRSCYRMSSLAQAIGV